MYLPQTEITFLKTPLSMDGEHQMVFTNSIEQETYFNTLEKLPFIELTYQKQDNAFRCPMNIDELYKYNYVMYKNSSVTNKYFYAYITKLEYVNNNMTLVHLKLDVFQTWCFDITYNKSFIERMHESLDEYNTLSDNVPTGQLVESNSLEKHFSGGYFVFCSTDITQDDTTTSTPYSFRIGNYTIPCLVLYWDESDANSMALTMQTIASKGWGDRILSAVYVPIVGDLSGININNVEVTSLGGYINICSGFDSISDLETTVNFNFSTSVDFKKSLTYPYAKIVLTDLTTGQSIELAPEKFATTTASFKIQCSVCETPTYKIIPMNYDGQSLAYNQALVTRCNTSLPIANNTYAKYMMMNGEMNNLKMGFAGVGMLGAVAGKSPMGVMSGIEQITNVIAQENQASKLPNQVSAITDGAMERILFQNGVKISLFTMDDFHKQMANDYWTMFGYPIRKLMQPSLDIGANFNYIRMVKPNIEGGNVPQNDLIEFENILSKGVTLWHNPLNYKQY